ncbi:hypothetical protein IEQ34_010595 [Dendrobium chrysotoxum]|uniref:Uncharacterized protein n=1 Tax=Dendrobium chrysotoxum TaxID=161865 RepID=A0AAV7GWG1_DENCH|nr:hypothetical protein IEQ34_010595 [Dendrobium chrysotoxum]
MGIAVLKTSGEKNVEGHMGMGPTMGKLSRARSSWISAFPLQWTGLVERFMSLNLHDHETFLVNLMEIGINLYAVVVILTDILPLAFWGKPSPNVSSEGERKVMLDKLEKVLKGIVSEPVPLMA